VLLALLDSDHIDHARAHRWLDREVAAGWASCPITENGFARIVSQPRYPSPISPTQAIELLAEATAHGNHEFWPCDVTVLDARTIDSSRLHGPRQLTDAYLLALAVSHRGRFATFDRSVSAAAVHGATDAHLAVI
jgi:toxin-antitoxin system PIN domain toxin